MLDGRARPRGDEAAHAYSDSEPVTSVAAWGYWTPAPDDGRDTRLGAVHARTACRCLWDPRITAWTTPAGELQRCDPRGFVRSRQTLFLLSKDGGGSAAPLVAA